MCSVNDAKRQQYQTQIDNLQREWDNEDAILKDLQESKEELDLLVSEADCAIDNLSNCDFGGTKILDSVRTSQKGYQDRIKYYEEYILKCQEAKTAIDKEKTAAINAMNALPLDCGVCYECNPPEEQISGSGNGGSR